MHNKTWTVIVASLGVFMTALDTLVVTTSLPALRVDLHASLSSLEWTVNAYNLAFACLLLTGAALGAGAAIVMPLTLSLISQAFPTEKRGAAIGLWGGITGLGVALGPVVGGAVVNGISWHWIFWLNVPVGIVLIPL